MISIESVRRYCLRKGDLVTVDFPFGRETLVIKVRGKMFLLTDITSSTPSINLKCDPHLALELRARYDAVQPGYHMNKKHWNTVALDGSIPDEEILGMIDHSYERVLAGLGKGKRPQSKGRTAAARNRKIG